ncbi:MAG: lamin tail domain-containing protein, partial [Bacteroidales bacterium]|nr:lamin tail domain-containing protein [Bacteroidales bacterium]
YIKTVTTSGGRMEAVDIDGEAIWTSETINISGYTNIVLSILVSETGSSTNTSKYVKVYYKLDGGAETLFAINGENIGNFGSVTASQNISSGTNIQIIVRINNPNAGDKTIFDEVTVIGDPPDVYPPQLISVATSGANNITLKFNETLEQTTAENTANYTVNNSIGSPQTATLDTDPSIVHLNFTGSFTENTEYALNIQNISDLSNNILTDTTAYFSYIPFRLNNFYVLDKNNLMLEFSRNLDATSSSDISNYTLDNSLGNPQTASLQTETNKVLLNFTSDFPENTLINLHIENLKDENNIVITPSDTTFYWHNATAYDLVFNEIMADPVPSVTLPEYEYLEIYNKTAYAICLNNWTLNIGTSSKTFPLINIEPNEFLLICSSSAQDSLNQFGKTVGILGSSDLTNSGKELALKNTVSETIDTIHYTIDWYQDTDKDNGGWSLERIDYENTCGQLSNWKAAVDTSGGTPGKQNSVYQANIDTIAPKLVDLTILNAHLIQLQFDDELFPDNISNLNNYSLDNSINPQSAVLIDALQNIVQIDFATDFTIGQHSLNISNIQDFCNNTQQIDTGFYYYPGFAFDILINELMLDISPEPNVLPAAKYIELYNKTDVDISLNGWVLNINNTSYTFDKTKIPAKSYLILSDENENSLFENYGKVKGIFSSSKLAADEGQISLYNASNQFIDYVHYRNSWYKDDEKDAGGWSLERIDPLNYCGQSENWKASNDAKGGTPGTQNSVYISNPDTTSFELQSITVLSSVKLLLQFSKNLSENAGLNPLNYSVDSNLGNPIFVDFSDSSRAYIIVQFAYQFIDAYTHTLTLNNLTDFCDNQLKNNTKQFIYYLISPKSAYAESKNLLKITFSEEVERVTAEQIENYSINELGNPAKAYKHNSLNNTVYLEFNSDFENGKEYTIHIENVKDLNGNAIRPDDLKFSWFKPSANNIVINEVLFNPKSGGVDYVEIYNNSLYPVDISLMKIANRNDENQVVNLKDLSDTNHLLYPTKYLCITSDSLITKNDYPAPSYGPFAQLSAMPSYPDDFGTVVLQFGDTIIDEFSYSKDMHSALIRDANGVSLERLNPDMPTQDKTNWYSAAENVGFGTPANKNSQFTTSENTDFTDILVEPEVFSPDGDGYDDRVFIKYKFSEPGYIANVSVYNKNGQLVKRLANNELLATEGNFAWDGFYENNQQATLGIYIVYFEVFNLKGEVKSYKKTCVVAAKLK